MPAIPCATHRSSYDRAPGHSLWNNGDGSAELATFSAGSWAWRSIDGTSTGTYGWGTAGDIPAPADYNGGGRTDYGVYRPSQTKYYVDVVAGPSFGDVIIGDANDVPVVGDLDGDGHADHGVFEAGVWTFKRSSDGTVSSFNWGTGGDIAVVCDFNGDGLADLGAYRPSQRKYYVSTPGGGTGVSDVTLGPTGGSPTCGFFDSDDAADFAVFDGIGNTFFRRFSGVDPNDEVVLGGGDQRPANGTALQ